MLRVFCAVLVCLALAWRVEAQPGLGASRPLLEIVRLGRYTEERPLRVDVRALGGTLGPELTDVMRADLSLFREIELVVDAPDVTLDASMTTRGHARDLAMTLDAGGSTRTRRFRGSSGDARGFVHSIANDVIGLATGTRASFGSHLVFARRTESGRKAIFRADFDGFGLTRLSSSGVAATLPSIDRDGVWYSIITPRRMFITRTGRREAPVIDGQGLDMGAHACGDRVLFTSTRDGNAEIYSAAHDGTDVRRLTSHPAIDVSPTCAPNGRIAFVSNRDGSPQIHSMSETGVYLGRLTDFAGESQTPVFCSDPDHDLLAFTHVHGRTDVRVMDLGTGHTRVVAGRGAKDPAFSPDCRFLAFARGDGIAVTRLDRLEPRLVVTGNAEAVRWGF